jgi:hypothetical protein
MMMTTTWFVVAYVRCGCFGWFEEEEEEANAMMPMEVGLPDETIVVHIVPNRVIPENLWHDRLLPSVEECDLIVDVDLWHNHDIRSEVSVVAIVGSKP